MEDAIAIIIKILIPLNPLFMSMSPLIMYTVYRSQSIVIFFTCQHKKIYSTVQSEIYNYFKGFHLTSFSFAFSWFVPDL